MVVVGTGHMGGSHIVSSADDVLCMSVVCGMRVGGVCELCMCLAKSGIRGEGGALMRGLVLGFTNPVGTKRVMDMCLGCVGVGGEWVGA